jgi:transmembrane sensor
MMKMNTRQSPQKIDQRAAEWAVRRCDGLLPQELCAFEAWLAADSRHVGAYAKAESVLAQLDRAGAAGADALRLQTCLFPQKSLKRRAMLVGSVAAGLAVAAGGATWLTILLRQEDYSTRIGETKEAVLSDGSLVTLNTNSRITVRYTKTRRLIHLIQGEVLFDVAKNQKRPFIVTAGDTQVRAVGTSFTVCMLPQQPVRVLVREGVVEIKRLQVPQESPVQLAANTVAVAPPDAPISTEPVASVRVSRDLAWREGRLAFDNEPLADAARQFARYSAIEILISPDLENQTVTGLFVSNDPVGFARAVAISLNLQLEVNSEGVHLSREQARR